jgi:hypothetical protein
MNLNEGQTAAQAMMTDYCNASDSTPTRAGPYQCKMIGGFADGDKTHMRWFDGENWSWPLQPEHERDDGFKQPPASYFCRDEVEIYNQRFAWRGFVEDQEPL